MNVKIKDGLLQVNIYDLLAALSDEEKLIAIDTLACMDSIIEQVVNQVVHGYTDMGSHAARDNGSLEPHTTLEKARRRVAEGASKVAEKTIDDLKEALKWAKAMEDEYSGAYYRLYHAWPGGPQPRGPSVQNAGERVRRFEVVDKEGV